MIFYKSEEQIALIKEGAIILGKAHAEVCKHIKPGVTTKFLDGIAFEYICDHGAQPSFKGYNGFPATLCISVNDAVVHGIPDSTSLRDGDLVSIDCGVYYQGLHSDSAYSYPVGQVSAEVKKLLEVTKTSLSLAIDACKQGNRIGDISYAVQSYVEKHNMSVVRELCGHGLGKDLHESPEVPNFGRRGSGIKLLEGLVIAIEPMVNFGKKEVYTDSDHWTIRTKDKKQSAHFEHTVVIRKNNAEVLTTFEYIEEVLKKNG
ncbi:MAG TPA: type I methionyl aminopeptidase [Cytophagales bacterium]|nr:type I methionyl aminopeptidase [Cytophagales bacterium]